MAFVSLDSPSCGVPCLILHSVVYRDVTRQTKRLYRLKHVEALKSGLAYLSRCNSGWFCHRKLAPRYVGPFEILETCGPVAYHLQLPPQLAAVHDVFHVSQLRKCIKTPTEIIDSQAIKIESDLSYTEHPIRILDTKERRTRKETVRMFKI
jgi:hypothetical protein